MAKNLVIVESPAKAKTIKKMLGRNTKVVASVGHVRDLPKSQIGVDVDNNFEPKYITIRGKAPVVNDLRKEAKAAEKVYLATDPDREGEAISWHLAFLLGLDENEANRIEFNEITKNAVKEAIKHPRPINKDLVDAQQGRRILDRLVGYKISPLLWKKIKGGLSAGRVQSAVLKMICDREEEIRNFTPEEYWSIHADIVKNKDSFKAEYYGHEKNGKIVKDKLANESQVDAILGKLDAQAFNVNEVKEGVKRRNPYAPFITSTMQQEASRKLGMTSRKTMGIAQALYEGIDIKGEGTTGLISYMRTDSTRISEEALKEVASFINENLGKEYAKIGRNYGKKKEAQDAHECIRPTSVFRTPDSVKEDLTTEQFKLYELIWKRFVSSQMAPAKYATISTKIRNGIYEFRASGSTIVFDGYMRIYGNDNSNDKILPKLAEGEVLKSDNVWKEQHFTQPPARFTEASLIKAMEDSGLGRPSTYTPTINTILSRYYVTIEDKKFYVTDLGETVNEVLVENFPSIVDQEFTAEMENELDYVAEGEKNWRQVVADFYSPFEKQLLSAEENIEKIEVKDEVTEEKCEKCGRNLVIKVGRYGKFLACPGFPECRYTKKYEEKIGMKCPKCGIGEIVVKQTKNKRRFYGCSEYPDCDYASWKKPDKSKLEDQTRE